MFQISHGLESVLKRLKSTQNFTASGVTKKVLIERLSETGSGTRSVMNWQISIVAVERVTSNAWLKALSTMARCIRHKGCT